jgi:hypothetical protein
VLAPERLRANPPVARSSVSSSPAACIARAPGRATGIRPPERPGDVGRTVPLVSPSSARTGRRSASGLAHRPGTAASAGRRLPVAPSPASSARSSSGSARSVPITRPSRRSTFPPLLAARPTTPAARAGPSRTPFLLRRRWRQGSARSKLWQSIVARRPALATADDRIRASAVTDAASPGVQPDVRCHDPRPDSAADWTAVS